MQNIQNVLNNSTENVTLEIRNNDGTTVKEMTLSPHEAKAAPLLLSVREHLANGDGQEALNALMEAVGKVQ
eukprot:gene6696-2608_t